MSANAVIEGTDTLEISLTDNTTSSVLGVSPKGASIINNQNSEVSSSVRAIQDAVEIKADSTIVTVNGTLENVYPLDSIDEEYTVTVTAAGYEEFTQRVTADADHIVQATLTPTGT